MTTITTTLDTPGWFSAYARKDKRFGVSKQIGVDAPSGASAPATMHARG